VTTENKTDEQCTKSGGNLSIWLKKEKKRTPGRRNDVQPLRRKTQTTESMTQRQPVARGGRGIIEAKKTLLSTWKTNEKKEPMS